MRRALIGTLAGWLTGAAGLMAQAPLPPLRDFDEPPAASRPTQSSHRTTSKPAPKYRVELPEEDEDYPPPRRSVREYPREMEERRAPTTKRPPREYVFDEEYRRAPRRPARELPPDDYDQLPPPRRSTRNIPIDEDVGPANALIGPRRMPYGPGYGPGYGPAYGADMCGPDGCGDPYGPWGCGPAGCNPKCPCGPCGPDGRIWGGAELLLWWTRGQFLPPLITQSPPGANGVLPGAEIIYGNGRVGEDMRPGLRVRAGAWFDECNMCGVEGSFYFLGNRNQVFVTPPCVPGVVVARPFFDVAPVDANGNPRQPGQSAEDVCDVDLIGTVTVRTYSDLYGADTNFRRNLVCHSDGRIDMLAGFRYQRVEDRLSIDENLFTLLTAPPGINFIVRDSFRTINDFYGGQLGLTGEFRSGRVFLDWRSLLAMGPTVHTVQIRGSTTRTIPGNPPTSQTRVGGLLALDTNIGDYQTTHFTVLPEAAVNLGYNVTNLVRLFVGYTFLYQSSIVRAGEQVDFTINSTHIPFGTIPPQGPLRPEFRFKYNSYWAQGVNFGIQGRY